MTIAPSETFSGFAQALASLGGKNRRDVLADAWREAALTVEDSIRFIRQHSRTLAEAGARLSSGEPLHGEAYLAGLRANMPWRLARYLEALRAVSEAEAEMTALGIPFAKSSDHWDETSAPTRPTRGDYGQR